MALLREADLSKSTTLSYLHSPKAGASLPFHVCNQSLLSVKITMADQEPCLYFRGWIMSQRNYEKIQSLRSAPEHSSKCLPVPSYGQRCLLTSKNSQSHQ